MTVQQQIQIVKELLNGVKELNGEFQDGWEETIKDGKKLLKYLEQQEQVDVAE